MTATKHPRRPSIAALRRCVLAVCVLEDLDLTPRERHVVLDGNHSVRVPWVLVRRAMEGADPESELGRERVSRFLRPLRWAADLQRAELVKRARPYGVPVDHVFHPGLDWIRQRVLGDTLDLGLGFVGIDPARPDDVIPIPEAGLRLLLMRADRWWPTALGYLEEMGAMAAGRLERRPDDPLKPMGDCDVVTLLGSRVFRSVLAKNAHGMRAVAVPMRTRGWHDIRHIDPAYASAAAAATAPAERGFNRPLLVTADEVVQVAEGGRPAEIVLRDPAPATAHLRDVMYR